MTSRNILLTRARNAAPAALVVGLASACVANFVALDHAINDTSYRAKSPAHTEPNPHITIIPNTASKDTASDVCLTDLHTRVIAYTLQKTDSAASQCLSRHHLELVAQGQ